MNWDLIKGDWHQLSRRLREKWKLLTDADLRAVPASATVWRTSSATAMGTKKPA